MKEPWALDLMPFKMLREKGRERGRGREKETEREYECDLNHTWLASSFLSCEY